MTALVCACMGDHDVTPILGTVTLPDGATPAHVATATAGYLCADCGDAFNYWRNEFDAGRPGLRPGEIPNRAAVDQALARLGRTRRNKR